MPSEMIPFPEFVRRLTDAGAHNLEDWQLAIVRDWTRPETRNVLQSMPRHHGRNQIDRYLDYARRAYEMAFEQNAENIRIAHIGHARMIDDEEPVQPTPYTTIRVREPAPENHSNHTHVEMVYSSREPSRDWQDAVMAAWFGHQRQQVPDEITDEIRERWANELETTPHQGNDSGGALSSDELLEAIGEAVTEWKDVRDE